MNAEASALVIDLAKELIQFMQQLDAAWTHAFFRFSRDAARCGSNASYVSQSKVMLIDPFRHQAFFLDANAKAESLLEALGKTNGVVLASVTNNFDYEVKFDFDNPDRWKITKLDGGTGLPNGISLDVANGSADRACPP